MMNHSVLHITDFHIGSNADPKDLFSDTNYVEYVDSILKSISDTKIKIDSIVFTGDFVDKGNVESFGKASEVINIFLKSLNLSVDNIGLCIGNHDIKRGKDDSEGKQDYIQFSETYITSPLKACANNRYYIKNLHNNVFYLSLDATYNRDGNKPGKLSNTLREEIVNAVKNLNIDHPNNLLIIGSHYPMTTFYEESLNDDNFFQKGLWQSAMPLYAQIKNTFKQMRLLWLFGDLHYSDFIEEENGRSIAILSGRVGSKVIDSNQVKHSIVNYKEIVEKNKDDKIEKLLENIQITENYIHNHSVQYRMFSVVQYSDDKETSIVRFKYIPHGHEDNVIGHWESYNAKYVKHPCNVPDIIPFESKHQEVGGYLEHDLEDNPIFKTIKDRRLYKFGRFHTRTDEVSLGWIPLFDIIGNPLIFPEIIINSKKWLDRILSDDEKNPNKTILIGIDYWGSIIASQLSVMTGFKNHCRASASKSSEKDYIPNEIFCQGLKLAKEENIIILTDVVSSGRTLLGVFEKLREYFQKKGLHLKKVICVSVLCDRNQDRKVKLDFLTNFGTLCGDVRIPVVEQDFLPHEVLLPPQKIYI